ncbi:MAG: hypothetical protein FJ020_10025, partial [Chloroflexi bacterium]|nr:hypothetical protein [Chloroflexota bacterium]
MVLTRAATAAIAVIVCALVLAGFLILPGGCNPASAEAGDSFRVARLVGEDGREMVAITVSGKPSPLSPEAVNTPDPDTQLGTKALSEVPAFDWSYGCSATSAAMLFGYYDRSGYGNMYAGPAGGGVCPLDNSIWGDTRYPSITCHECPLSATCLGVDNRTSAGHVDDYWIDYNSRSDDPFITAGWAEHIQGDCTGDFMGTNQSRLGNRDGATTFYYYTSGDPLHDYQPSDPERRDGGHGMRLFAESRGYAVAVNFNQYIRGQGSNPSKGFTFSNFVEEIDAGRPVLIQLEGHTVLGFGYSTSGNQIYIRDTWDHSAHQMTWGGSYAGMEHYGVSVIRLAEPTTPLVVTDDASDVTDTSATLNGSLAHLGPAASVEVSFEWGLISGSYTGDTESEIMTATGPFSCHLGDLTPGTTYYYRAKRVSDETGYGIETSFTTTTTPPSVVTGNATRITATAATLNGSLASTGSAEDASVSFEWGTAAGEYLQETAPQTLAAAGPFSFGLSGLSPGVTYYYRAKAVGHGTSYGDQESLVTLTVPPSVVTGQPTAVAARAAMLNGSLVDLGTAASASVSFQWGTSSGSYSSQKILVAMTATGPFSYYLGGLTPGTTYYYRARAVGDGTGYGLEQSFTTLTLPPTVTTQDVAEVGVDSARLDAYLGSLGSAASVDVSFVWGTSPGSYPNEHVAGTMTSAGPFQAELPNLAPGATYYFRARAAGEGVSYGAEKSFTTSTTPPSVTTTAATAVGTNQAWLHGDLTGLGTAPAVVVSCQWGTRPGYYSGETEPQMVTDIGPFGCALPNLNPGTTYYYRAKAAGDSTSYGLEQSFATATLPPSITGVEATGVTADAAKLEADLASLGTANCVDVCFQWGTNAGDYDGQTSAIPAVAPGTVSAQVTGLLPETTYYFRAAAAGVHGVCYGMEGSFITPAVPPSMVMGQAGAIAEATATLSVNLVALGSAESVDVFFKWATTPGGPYTEESPSQTVTSTGAVSIEIGGLTPDTTYYYVAASSGDLVTCS